MEEINKYDDSAKGGYSYAEKLQLVAEDKMDPKEIGLASADQAKLQVMPDAEPNRKFGDFITFEASVVPLALRARWARQDEKVIPIDTAVWEANWIEAHRHEYAIQCRARCGNALATLERLVTEPHEGFFILLDDVAKLFREEKQRQTQVALPAVS